MQGVSLMMLTVVIILAHNDCMAWKMKDVWQNVNTNMTNPGSFQTQAAGYYSGGGMAIRTKGSYTQPFAVSPPSLSTGCKGLDAYFGSFSVMNGQELVNVANNLGSSAAAYGFHLALKTYAPQIENTLTDLRNLAMELNQFGINHCKLVQSGFAATLPKRSAMREKVCEEMRGSSGGDYFAARKRCKTLSEENAAVSQAQNNDKDLMIDNYNVFAKAAEKAGIPFDMYNSLMSLVGTIVVKNKISTFHEPLANDFKSFMTYLRGGESGAMYNCDNKTCLNVTLNKKIKISKEESYQGKAAKKLGDLKIKLQENKPFDNSEINFLSSMGDAFPVYDYISLEAISNITIIDNSSEIVARYILLQHLQQVISDVKKSVSMLQAKQILDEDIIKYQKSLNRLQIFAQEQWEAMLTKADQIELRARRIEQHLIARERS